ncbi:hypothetical protein [Clostridium saccharobutylicum]|uniref:Uncharacterized protein n=1 Tax=Clostridium saccharobutylicum TaxID=169679 RepID=A0A1S8NJX3_CLOSA|nr:hypothetical protein [Clostridium saccharobutylicum]OOM16750.1 hypothetical protein CLOSAC_10440 [Clostridium saccharobutylicum]
MKILKDIEKFKEQIRQSTFYYHKPSLFIKSQVTNVVDNGDFLEVAFEGGNVDIFIEDIKQVRRPGNLVASFAYCYMLKNEDDEIIGYIGKVVS